MMDNCFWRKSSLMLHTKSLGLPPRILIFIWSNRYKMQQKNTIWNVIQFFYAHKIRTNQYLIFRSKIIYQDTCSGIWLICKCYGTRYFEKCVGILEFPGSGKTWNVLYTGLYSSSKGIFVFSTALTTKMSIQLGENH